MANTNRVCKYYARGTCLKGEQCRYSHEINTSENICHFYQKGHCAFGSRCRYKHVNVFQAQTSALSSANGPQSVVPGSGMASSAKGKSSWVPKATQMLSPVDNHCPIFQYKRWHSQGNGGDVGESSSPAVPAEHVFCAYNAADCPSRDKCSSIHGQQCLYCKKPCLLPTDQKQMQNHLKTCEGKVKALKDSEDIECSVCLERVLLKPIPVQRKFGLLPECGHAFCLSCIRNWRNRAPTPGLDCPVCRKQSSFFVKSDIWYADGEEKQALIDKYKANCKLIDCRNFNFGNGHCSLGTGCLYKHTAKPGSHKQKHNRPRPPGRGNNFDKYDMLAELSQFDLLSGEFYSIMNDMDWFNDMDPFEKMAWADALAGGSDDEGMMAGLSGAMFEDSDDEEFNPVDAAMFSIMMHSNMDEEWGDDDEEWDDDDEYNDDDEDSDEDC